MSSTFLSCSVWGVRVACRSVFQESFFSCDFSTKIVLSDLYLVRILLNKDLERLFCWLWVRACPQRHEVHIQLRDYFNRLTLEFLGLDLYNKSHSYLFERTYFPFLMTYWLPYSKPSQLFVRNLTFANRRQSFSAFSSGNFTFMILLLRFSFKNR